jgi:cytoskeleton protein RodZ
LVIDSGLPGLVTTLDGGKMGLNPGDPRGVRGSRSALAGASSIREICRVSADANPALQQLGRRLSEARQACGFSLEEHADRLHMGREQLQALEAGNREGLPEPVFVIAQARRVATSLGIEIDEEIAALRSSDGFQTPQASRPAPQPPEPAVPPAAGQPALQRPAALPITLMALVSLLVAAAALLALRGLAPPQCQPSCQRRG